MVMFVFVLSCLIFISTVTWLSYQLADAKEMNPISAGFIGFVLSLVPPVGLVYIAYLAFKKDPERY